jgi:hypothetical protein
MAIFCFLQTREIVRLSGRFLGKKKITEYYSNIYSFLTILF